MIAATIPMGVVLVATTRQYRYPPGSGARGAVRTVSGCGPAYADGPTATAKPTVATMIPILEDMRFIALPSSALSCPGPCDLAMTWRDESKGGANGGRPNAKRDKVSILRLKGTAMSGRAAAGRAKPP